MISSWNIYDVSQRSPKVVRKEMALELNARWDSITMGSKIYVKVDAAANAPNLNFARHDSCRAVQYRVRGNVNFQT